MINKKILIKTPTEAFDAVKKAIDHYIEKDCGRQAEAEKLRQSLYNFINKHYEVESPMIEVGKKYICKNGVVVALISCSSFIAVTAVHKNENLVSTAMDEEWNTFGKANDCEFDIECESSTY